ncbi:MAG: carbohydrate ABC transporter permease [Anaerolineae bacterium]
MTDLTMTQDVSAPAARPRRPRTRWGVHIGLSLICFILIVPALLALQMATLPVEESIAPFRIGNIGTDFADNLNTLFTRLNFGQLLLNTLLVTGVTVIGKLMLALMAGMVVVYYQFRGRAVVFFFILITLLIPTEVILLPLFNIMSELKWGELHPPLALTVPFLATATGVFLFRQHFRNIPRELAEAAQIDGASPARFMWDVLIPLSWNVMVAFTLIMFISSWNQYLWPVLVIPTAEDQVIQVGVRRTLEFGLSTDFGVIMTAGLVASLPSVILFILLQKQFMSGFALTADK